METLLHFDWLNQALEHITVNWLQVEMAQLLPQLVAGEISSQQFAQQFIAMIENRGLTTPTQQKNYRSNLTQALKSIDPHHPAIELVALSTETYRELNDIQRGRLGQAQTKFITSATADNLVKKAAKLLTSAEWSDIGAGLAVLIGRRVSEILLSRFEPCSSWSILFRNPAKKAPGLAADFVIEIPTLALADTVLKAITKLQQSLKVDDIKAAALTSKGAKQKVNQRYSSPISAACNRHFAGIVESRDDRDDLYSHLFRAVYATIAAHWFCPPTVPEHLFKAEIQGHFTIGADGAKLPNFSARANYDDYAVGDGKGNRDGRLGIKLGTGEVQIIRAFRTGKMLLNQTDAPTAQLLSHPISEPLSQPDPLVLNDLPTEPTTLAQQSDVTLDLRLDDSDFDAKFSEQQQQTPMSLTKLSSLRFDSTDRDRWLDLLDLIAPDATTQPERMAELLDWAEQQIDNAIHQTQQQPAEPVQSQTEAIPELAKTLSWLTGRIETLEAEAIALKAERDLLLNQQQQPQNAEQLQRLQAENQQLKDRLTLTQNTLDHIRQSLGLSNGAALPAAATTPAALPAISPEQPVVPQSPRRSLDDSTAKIHQIIDSIISWNSAQDDAESMLRVSIPIIKAIGKPIGATYQKAIQQVLDERETELEQFHSRHLLGVRHNASVKSRDNILQAIARDYLALENSQSIQ